MIVELDGQTVDDPDAFGYRFALKGLGGETDLTVMRGAKRTAVRVRLQTPPETRPREPVRVRSRSPLAGVTVVNLSPAVADELRLDVDAEGVAIAEVDEGSAASRVGFRKGDLILAINGERVSASRDVERLIRGGGGTWRITINRGGQVLTSVLGG